MDGLPAGSSKRLDQKAVSGLIRLRLNRFLLAPVVAEWELKCCESKNRNFLAFKEAWGLQEQCVPHPNVASRCNMEGKTPLQYGDNWKFGKMSYEGLSRFGGALMTVGTPLLCLTPKTRVTVNTNCQQSNFIIFFRYLLKVLMDCNSLESQKCCCCYLNPVRFSIWG